MALGSKPNNIKEPDLSQEMISIIERSHRQGDGEGYDDIDSYKYLIMDILTKNQDILKTLHRKDLEQEDKKINGNKLALNSGINRSNINRFLRGQNKSITIESIALICQALDITLKDFFDDKVFENVDVSD